MSRQNGVLAVAEFGKIVEPRYFPGLLAVDDDKTPANVVELRGTGILPSQRISAMIDDKIIASFEPITPSQIQPASLDLRLGKRAYRVRASFLPGPGSSVMDRVAQLDGLPEINLETGAVFEKGAVYVAEIYENVRLTSDIIGTANPKSSTGRLDVLTRLITNRASAFDRIEAGYKGPLYVEIAPLTFSIVVQSGARLNQVRFHRGKPELNQKDAQSFYEDGQLIGAGEDSRQLRNGLVPVTVDLRGSGEGSVIGYKAKQNTNKIDVSRVDYYDPREFWDKIEYTGGLLNLDKNGFYILVTREDVGVPPMLAAEMMPYDTGSGEFRVHYAGFFDPGFGWSEGRAGGSKAVLEVRSHGVPFTLEHGQIVGWLCYSRLASGRPEKLYGADISSNYQGQGVALAKHFKTWP